MSAQAATPVDMVSMVSSGSSAGETQALNSPTVKRKRKASCLGEQERRERKRAVDREAQRTLREKTRLHIATLEKTIETLRSQDTNTTTATLLDQITELRKENERLRGTIDSIKAALTLGADQAGTPGASTNVSEPAQTRSRKNGTAPAERSEHQPSFCKPSSCEGILHELEDTPVKSMRTNALSDSNRVNSYANPISSEDVMGHPPMSPTLQYEYVHDVCEHRQYDHLDGLWNDGSPAHPPMVHLADSTADVIRNDSAFSPGPAVELGHSSLDLFKASCKVPDTFGLDGYTSDFLDLCQTWTCPDPILLTIGTSQGPGPTIQNPDIACPIWNKCNSIFEKMFKIEPVEVLAAEDLDVGVLFQAFNEGWSSLSLRWRQNPLVTIVREVDEYLFSHLSRIEKLAIAYKNLILMKYYLNPNKKSLEALPKWLRPRPSQTRTKHPVNVDFFAWPAVRDRLVQNYPRYARTTRFSKAYQQNIKFDWPLAFQDTFTYDRSSGTYHATPLFERSHKDLTYWGFRPAFFEQFPEMMQDMRIVE